MTGAPTLSKSEICNEKPSNSTEHNAMHQERWGEFSHGYAVGKVVCERGDTGKDFKSTLMPDVDGGSLWGTSHWPEKDPMVVSAYIGKEYFMNAEVIFDTTRNWPSFTGFGVRSYNSNPSNSNTMYLRYIATVWMNEAGERIRVACTLDGKNTADNNHSHFWNYEFKSSTAEYTTQQEGFRLCGFLFHLRTMTGMGSAEVKSVPLYDLRLHTNPESMPDGTRAVLPAMRKLNDTVQPLGYGDQI